MTTISKILRHRALGVALFAAIAFPALVAAGELVNKGPNDIAIEGYDTVAYFTQGQPVLGTSDFEHTWQDAKWLFSSAEHRDLFAAAPEQYAPRYGGYCAMAMADGLVYVADPETWVIVNGKLYLNYNKEYGDRFAADPTTAIAEADGNWEARGGTE